MDNDEAQPETFVEMVLALLKDRFPWPGKDEPATRAETGGATMRLGTMQNSVTLRRSRLSD
jgi:hypothetical protein